MEDTREVQADQASGSKASGLDQVGEMPGRMVVEEQPAGSLPQPKKKPAKKGSFDPEKLSSYFTENFAQTFGLEDVDVELEQASLANAPMNTNNWGRVGDFVGLIIWPIGCSPVAFRKKDVPWRGGRHMLDGFKSYDEDSTKMSYARYVSTDEIKDLRHLQLNFALAMATLEMDKGLVMPRELLAPFVSALLPAGPMTGMSLVVLFAQSDVVRIERHKDEYSVGLDSRVWRAVPSFHALVIRAIWDLRQLSDELRGKSFEVRLECDTRGDRAKARARGFKPLYPYPGQVKKREWRRVVTEPPVIELPEVPSKPEGQACEDGADGGRLDAPAFVISLMAQDWLFFGEDGIEWTGTQHIARDVQVNVAKKDELVSFANRYAKGLKTEVGVVRRLKSFLKELETDKGLWVPEEQIAEGISESLPDGPLTGMVLASLASFGGAISMSISAEDEYEVTYDGRLAAGIPSFFNLVARMLWDLREMVDSSKGRPFKVSFREVNHAATDIYLPQLDAPVKGAQPCPGTMEVKELPEIVLE